MDSFSISQRASNVIFVLMMRLSTRDWFNVYSTIILKALYYHTKDPLVSY